MYRKKIVNGKIIIAVGIYQSPKRSEESSRRFASLRPRRSEAKILKSWTRRSEARRKLVEAKRSDLKSATSVDLTFPLVLNQNLLIFINFITISCEKYVISQTVFYPYFQFQDAADIFCIDTLKSGLTQPLATYSPLFVVASMFVQMTSSLVNHKLHVMLLF